MTSTNVVVGQTIGTGANAGEDLYPFKVTAQTVTDRLTVEASVLNGSAQMGALQRIKVWIVSSAINVAAALAPAQLRSQAELLELIPEANAAATKVRRSKLIPLQGPFIYGWVDVNPADPAVAQTLNVWVNEGP